MDGRQDGTSEEEEEAVDVMADVELIKKQLFNQIVLTSGWQINVILSNAAVCDLFKQPNVNNAFYKEDRDREERRKEERKRAGLTRRIS